MLNQSNSPSHLHHEVLHEKSFPVDIEEPNPIDDLLYASTRNLEVSN